MVCSFEYILILLVHRTWMMCIYISLLGQHATFILTNFLFLGIPDEGGLRPLCWKLLLNYLPPTRASWSETLMRKRILYKTFIGIPRGRYFICNTERVNKRIQQ